MIIVHVYRSEVLEPASDINSEHELDNYCTNFLLILDNIDGEFERTVSRFSQYKDHIISE